MGSVRAEAGEQPDRVQALLSRTDEARDLLRRLTPRFDDVLIVARGSSDNAARYAQYVFGARHGFRVGLGTPSVISRFGAPPDLRRTLTLGISQSGVSPDVVAVLAEGRRQGGPTLAITNDPASPLATTAECVFALDAGPERAVAATKTYTCSLAAVALLSAVLDESPDSVSALAAVPAALANVLDGDLPDEAVTPWVTARRGMVVGRGYEYATAYETALKLQELGGVIAQPHSAADVRHGPIGGLTGDVPVVLFAVHGSLADDLRDVAAMLSGRAPVTTIGTLEDVHRNGHVAWRVPVLDEWLMPLVTVGAGQRLALAVAGAMGLDADHPVGLTKVTRTL